MKDKKGSKLVIKDFIKSYGDALDLELVAGQSGIKRVIKSPETERPGLSLSGYLRGYSKRRVLIFGKVEMEYMRDLDPLVRYERLKGVISSKIPLIIVARRFKPFKEMVTLCEEGKIPLFRSSLTTTNLLSSLTVALADEFSPTKSCHATLVEAFGIGVLIQGDSSVGKSEAALGLIERRHRLISDDVVVIKKREGTYLEGTGPELTRHMLEIRGIGIINVAHLYGAVCISEKKRIDIIVKLEAWDNDHFYDRVGIEEKFRELLGVQVPYYVMPVKPGRDVASLIETLVLNHRLKDMGYNSAKEFNVKLLETISKNQNALV